MMSHNDLKMSMALEKKYGIDLDPLIIKKIHSVYSKVIKDLRVLPIVENGKLTENRIWQEMSIVLPTIEKWVLYSFLIVIFEETKKNKLDLNYYNPMQNKTDDTINLVKFFGLSIATIYILTKTRII